jgi:signal peptidase I
MNAVSNSKQTDSPYAKNSGKSSIRRLLPHLLAALGCVFALLIVTYGCYLLMRFRAYSIPSIAMEPTINAGDRLFVDQHYYSHHRIADGDLVAFRHNEFILIKRVTALAGETIEGRDGVLLRNGVAVNEPYAQHSSEPLPQLETFPPLVVPEGEIFVTGDNRDHSLDSRSDEFGIVHPSDVMGRASFVYWSKKGKPGPKS